MMAGESPYLFLAVTAHSRTEKYIPLVRDLIDTFWPSHPSRYFVTDGVSPSGADVISFSCSNWVQLASAGLTRIKQDHPQATHVFLMLEDHSPLRACDEPRLGRIFQIAVREGFSAISFPTYAWPWQETDSRDYPDGLIRTWRHKETIERDGEMFAVVPSEFFRYFQVQPTLWHLDYLQVALDHALTRGITDAWSFEAMRWPQALPHYVSQYNWPTVHHGFLEQGKLNTAAIVYLDRRHAMGAYRMLVREAIGVESPTLFDSLQFLNRAKARIRGGLGRVKRAASTRAR
jgi:hypothetical protein